MKSYTLVGGTALALHLGHRQSEDLDFIVDKEQISSTTIKRNIAKCFPSYRILREEKGYQLDFLIDGVKVTFFSTGAVLIPFSVAHYAHKFGNLMIASVEIVSVLKMATIAQRCTIRDYYDLYYLSKYVLGLEKIYKLCKEQLPNLSAITYSETIVYVDDIPEETIEGHLNPKESITKYEMAEYFKSEIKKMLK